MKVHLTLDKDTSIMKVEVSDDENTLKLNLVAGETEEKSIKSTHVFNTAVYEEREKVRCIFSSLVDHKMEIVFNDFKQV